MLIGKRPRLPIACVNARAYTMGNHIPFADGHYGPTTKPGQRLMAHELSHVLQQRASRQ